jgi:predicted acyl esterase
MPYVLAQEIAKKLVLNWFDRWLKLDRNTDLGPRVEIQDSDGRWRAAASWPPPNRETVYLGSDGRLRPRPGGQVASRLLAPDQRSRYYFLVNRPLLNTNDDSIPVPPAVDQLCVTCALFRMKVTDTLRMSGIPTVNLQVTPTGPAGHVSAFLYAFDVKQDRMRRLGWGQTDLRFPNGGTQAQTVVPGQQMKLTIDFVPLETVIHKGEQVVLVLVLSQGHPDHMPTTGSFPVRLDYGDGLGRLEYADIHPSRDRFFVPPKAPMRRL